jgi:hypothetical protein
MNTVRIVSPLITTKSTTYTFDLSEFGADEISEDELAEILTRTDVRVPLRMHAEGLITRDEVITRLTKVFKKE